MSRFWNHHPAPAVVVLLAQVVIAVLAVWICYRLVQRPVEADLVAADAAADAAAADAAGAAPVAFCAPALRPAASDPAACAADPAAANRHWLLTQLLMLATLGIAGCLISPISWSHHWVWMGLVLAVLVAQRRWVAAALNWAVFYVAIQWVLPGACGSWTTRGIRNPTLMPTWQVLLAQSFVLVGLWWLGYVAWSLRGRGVLAQQHVAPATKAAELVRAAATETGHKPVPTSAAVTEAGRAS